MSSREEIKCDEASKLDAYPAWSSTALHLFHHVLQSTHTLDEILFKVN